MKTYLEYIKEELDTDTNNFRYMMKILNQNLKKPKSSKNIGIGIIISVNNFKFFERFIFIILPDFLFFK